MGIFVLFGMLVVFGCRKTEQERTPAPVASVVPSGNVATADATSVPFNRVLALQKPEGATTLDKEIEILQKAATKNPDSMDTWILLGRAWARKARRTRDPGFWLNTDACAKIVFEREPKHRLARQLSAMVLLEQHAFADAKDAAEQLLLEDKDDLDALGLKSDAALELGQFDEALTAAQKMVDLKPNLPSYARAAHLRWLQGDTDAAKSIYRAAFDARDPRDPEPFAWVLTEAAMIFWHQGDIDGADKGFDKALEALSDEPSALIGKARVALAKGNAKGAAEFAEKAYSRSPVCEALWIVGDARQAAGDEKGAEEAYQRFADCARKGDRRILASFYATKDRNHDEALSLIKGEAKVRQDVHTRDVLAWALFRKGDFAAARAESDAAIAHGTKEPILLYHAGAIRIAQGEKKDGEKLVREALALNPHFEPTAMKEAKKLLGEAP
jgi:tetratricopeptide (TPR) repeat protein